MANPIPVACPAGEYTKVATGAQTGNIYLQELDPTLDVAFFAFNDEGDGIPSVAPQTALSTAVQIEDRNLGISFTTPKDIYIWPLSDNVAALPSISTP